jgi:hypothetical protein
MVGQIKRAAADLVDLIETIPLPDVNSPESAMHSNEVARLRALAQTDIETAAMHAVKAATKKPVE